MKEFEKWHNDYGCSLSVDCGDISCNIICKEIRAETWRAALEWALSRIRDRSISYEQGHNEIEEEFKP